jgi:hypothetical protein
MYACHSSAVPVITDGATTPAGLSSSTEHPAAQTVKGIFNNPAARAIGVLTDANIVVSETIPQTLRSNFFQRSRLSHLFLSDN